MRLTVAICTYNRAPLLHETLQQLARVRVPDDVEWELLVVNNNCTDGTDAVVESFETRLPIRLLHERTPGQSAARNLAVAKATGDYLVWTDDDVLVDEDWLGAYTRAFRQWPDAVVFGGPIEPWFEGEPPEWLESIFEHVRPAFATIDLGPHPVPLAPPEHLPYGANMAFRTAEQRRFVYDVSLGLKPGGQMRGEETALLWNLLASEGAGWWVPDAKVRHFIPAGRQTWTFLRRFYAGYGHYLAQAAPDFTSAQLLGRPRWLWRSLASSMLKYAGRRVTGAPPPGWIEHFKDFHIALGHLRRHPNTRRRVAVS